MNPIRAIYRAVTPTGVRESVAARRFSLWRWATGPGLREPAARAWVGLGRPVRAVQTRYGTVFADLRDRGVGRPLFVYRGFETTEIEFIRSRLEPGMTFLDVGANVGCYTVAAAAAVGETGRVVAIEPDPHNFALLTRGIAANGLRNVTALNIAAGPEPGIATLYRSAENLGDHRLYAEAQTGSRAGVRVPVERLDDTFDRLKLPPPDVGKIDVQGFEESVVRGMPKLLGGDRPMTWLTEFWPHGLANAGGNAAGYLAAFRDRGFGCAHVSADGRAEPVAWDAVWGLVPPLDPARPDFAMTNLVFTRPAS